MKILFRKFNFLNLMIEYKTFSEWIYINSTDGERLLSMSEILREYRLNDYENNI